MTVFKRSVASYFRFAAASISLHVLVYYSRSPDKDVLYLAVALLDLLILIHILVKYSQRKVFIVDQDTLYVHKLHKKEQIQLAEISKAQYNNLPFESVLSLRDGSKRYLPLYELTYKDYKAFQKLIDTRISTESVSTN